MMKAGNLSVNIPFQGFYPDPLEYEETIFLENEEQIWPTELQVTDLFGFPTEMVFEEMTSPREYNFETDRIFVQIPHHVLQRIFDLTDTLELKASFARRFTSRSGFWSFYDPVIPEKPLEDWDHNELGTLFSHLDLEPDAELYAVLDECVDWDKVTAARRKLLEDWDHDEVAIWAKHHEDQFLYLGGDDTLTFHYRLTPDLFEQQRSLT